MTHDASHALDHCENCHAPLHGEYCHDCGQSVHNPVRHAGHALEEVFESFWHLDGRVFRTLRDLMFPGRVVLNYLAGHRVRYIPPLRMFVILSVLTFFIGKLTLHVGDGPVVVDVNDTGIRQSQTVAEVEQRRDQLLAELATARKDASGSPIPGVDATLIAAEVKIRGEADNRIVELREAARARGETLADTAPATPVPSGGSLFSSKSERWDPGKNRVQIDWLPGFANGWLTHRMEIANDNVRRMDGRGDLYFQAFMKSLPSALFVLVPVFALLLKLAYLFKRRLYLEHMVVALYSHCFLLLALTGTFLLSGLAGAASGMLGWLGPVSMLGVAALVIWMPIYLLLTQKRVYQQGWPMTLLKYLVIGNIYFFLLTLAASLMFIVTLAKPL